MHAHAYVHMHVCDYIIKGIFTERKVVTSYLHCH